ncbi:MAG: cytochrome c [Myxococcales bacterium]|nr:cytochrome c [Myxococcales bacterium]
MACGSEKKDSGSAEPAATPAAKGTPAKAAPKADTKPVAAAAADDEGAKALFAARCTACHGDSGKGDGPGSAALNPKPQDYTNAEWQASVTDEDISAAIVKGGLAVGKSAIMPANPDLKNKPAVVKGLVNMIRDFEE